MKHLKHLLTKPLNPVKTKVVVFAFVVALLGFADATYLTVEHYQGKVPPCTITSGCEQVLTSAYAVVAGVPVSLLGSIFYLVVLVGLFFYLDFRHTSVLKWTLLLTIPAFLASMVFVYLQVFIIHSYCVYCLGSAATSTILFVIAMNVFARHQVQ